MSLLKPFLDDMGVKFVGVGLEQFGKDEFIEGGFWSGQLFINENKTIHQAMSLAKKGFTSGFGLFAKSVRVANKAAKKAGFKGNLKGDGFQLGATLVFGQGGELLFEFRQDNYGDHASNADIFVALGGDPSVLPDETTAVIDEEQHIPE